MILLLDVGNTRIKRAFADDGRLHGFDAVPHAGQPMASVLDAWTWPDALIRRIVVASVTAPAREAELTAWLCARFAVVPELARSPAAALGVANAYAEPAKLGVDRFLALVALHRRAAALYVHGGLGTAMTLDVLAADGRHLGGAILPGLAMMRQAVLGGTARTGHAVGRFHDFSVTTADAIASGAVYAAVGAVERFRAAAEARFGQRARLVLSGGGAGEIAAFLPDAGIEAALVLQGLAAWAARPTGTA